MQVRFDSSYFYPFISHSPQLALALARLFENPVGGRDYTFHKADQQALCSVITFLLGAALGRIGDKMGAKTRLWMFLGKLHPKPYRMHALTTP